MDMAASWPCFIASTADLGPVTPSPPAKMPSSSVASVSGSVINQPPRVVLTPVFSGNTERSVAWPIAIMTVSPSTDVVTLSSKVGLNFPSASNTAVHFLKCTPVTLPSLLTISVGPQEFIIFTPSSTASSISQGWAGISSEDSRQTAVTSLAPSRRAVRATSMATLPPPMTTTLSPISTFLP